MKTIVVVSIFSLMTCVLSCKTKQKTFDVNIVFLHHSTGESIWNGTPPSFVTKAAGKISEKLADITIRKPYMQKLLDEYNERHDKKYNIDESIFPKADPYGWNNFPFDYYNIWVKNAAEEPFMKEPTLEILTKEYQVIIFKHCFPVSNIQEDGEKPDIESKIKTISNYKLQYSALKDKLHQFPATKFILFTGAAQVKNNISVDEAKRAKDFFKWVTEEWDIEGDNIYLWDLYSLQTEEGLYFKDENAVAKDNSHPNRQFARKAAELLFARIIDVVENDGNKTTISGFLSK